QYRHAGFDQSDGDAIFRQFVDVGLRAIDRIYDPHPRFIQPDRIVRGFLGEPAVVGEMCVLHVMQDAIDFEISARNGRTISLGLNLEALLSKVHGPFSGMPDRTREDGELAFHRVRVTGLPVGEKKNLPTPARFPLTPCSNLRTSLLRRGRVGRFHGRTRWSSLGMKLVQKRSKKTGLPPGTLVHIGERRPDKVTLHVFHYNAAGCEELQPAQVDQLSPPADESMVWINVGGVHNIDVLERLGKQFSLHPLLLEDVANTYHRPKLDDYEDYLFLVVKMLLLTERKEIAIEQVSLVLGRNDVISFQENGSDVFQPVRERLRGGKGRLRPSKSDYLLYALIDAIVDQYFAVLEAMGERLEAVQQTVVDDPKPETLN